MRWRTTNNRRRARARSRGERFWGYEEGHWFVHVPPDVLLGKSFVQELRENLDKAMAEARALLHQTPPLIVHPLQERDLVEHGIAVSRIIRSPLPVVERIDPFDLFLKPPSDT
jgi:hypothetical protein